MAAQRMTHAQRYARRKAIAQYVKAGHTPAEACREFGMSHCSVLGACDEWGIDVRKDVAASPPNTRVPIHIWVAVDWTKQDIAIAEELGVTRERVRVVRRRFQKPDPPCKGKVRPGSRSKLVKAQ